MYASLSCGSGYVVAIPSLYINSANDAAIDTDTLVMLLRGGYTLPSSKLLLDTKFANV